MDLQGGRVVEEGGMRATGRLWGLAAREKGMQDADLEKEKVTAEEEEM